MACAGSPAASEVRARSSKGHFRSARTATGVCPCSQPSLCRMSLGVSSIVLGRRGRGEYTRRARSPTRLFATLAEAGARLVEGVVSNENPPAWGDSGGSPDLTRTFRNARRAMRLCARRWRCRWLFSSRRNAANRTKAWLRCRWRRAFFDRGRGRFPRWHRGRDRRRA
jgi:hypothetical protein